MFKQLILYGVGIRFCLSVKFIITMSNLIKEETDFERTKRYFSEIKNSIPKFTDNIEYISQNVDLLNKRGIG